MHAGVLWLLHNGIGYDKYAFTFRFKSMQYVFEWSMASCILACLPIHDKLSGT